jgi:hypothetical protein
MEAYMNQKLCLLILKISIETLSIILLSYCIGLFSSLSISHNMQKNSAKMNMQSAAILTVF